MERELNNKQLMREITLILILIVVGTIIYLALKSVS